MNKKPIWLRGFQKSQKPFGQDGRRVPRPEPAARALAASGHAGVWPCDDTQGICFLSHGPGPGAKRRWMPSAGAFMAGLELPLVLPTAVPTAALTNGRIPPVGEVAPSPCRCPQCSHHRPALVGLPAIDRRAAAHGAQKLVRTKGCGICVVGPRVPGVVGRPHGAHTTTSP